MLDLGPLGPHGTQWEDCYTCLKELVQYLLLLQLVLRLVLHLLLLQLVLFEGHWLQRNLEMDELV